MKMFVLIFDDHKKCFIHHLDPARGGLGGGGGAGHELQEISSGAGFNGKYRASVGAGFRFGFGAGARAGFGFSGNNGVGFGVGAASGGFGGQL